MYVGMHGASTVAEHFMTLASTWRALILHIAIFYICTVRLWTDSGVMYTCRSLLHDEKLLQDILGCVSILCGYLSCILKGRTNYLQLQFTTSVFVYLTFRQKKINLLPLQKLVGSVNYFRMEGVWPYCFVLTFVLTGGTNSISCRSVVTYRPKFPFYCLCLWPN
jgi:hypothetical protein